MFVEAISNESIDEDYLMIDIGDIVYGWCRGYMQESIIIEYIDEVEDDTYFECKKRRINIKKGSIKRPICGCSNFATMTDIYGVPYCDECEHETHTIHEGDVWTNEYDRGWA